MANGFSGVIVYNYTKPKLQGSPSMCVCQKGLCARVHNIRVGRRVSNSWYTYPVQTYCANPCTHLYKFNTSFEQLISLIDVDNTLESFKVQFDYNQDYRQLYVIFYTYRTQGIFNNTVWVHLGYPQWFWLLPYNFKSVPSFSTS